MPKKKQAKKDTVRIVANQGVQLLQLDGLTLRPGEEVEAKLEKDEWVIPHEEGRQIVSRRIPKKRFDETLKQYKGLGLIRTEEDEAPAEPESETETETEPETEPEAETEAEVEEPAEEPAEEPKKDTKKSGKGKGKKK